MSFEIPRQGAHSSPKVMSVVTTGSISKKLHWQTRPRRGSWDFGADDYLMKPFSFSELSARIRALLRRSRLPLQSVLTVEDLKLDRVERRVTRGNRAIELTAKEFALLEYLMRNAGRRVTRSMIIEHVWNVSFDSSTNLVDVYINYGLRVTQLAEASTTN